MTFKKYNSTNNASCLLSLPILNSDSVLIAKGNYNRFPTANFIIKVTQYVSGVVTGRENMLIATRSGATFTVAASGRAYEAVPTDDTATSNIQQALPFLVDAVIECVQSAEFMKDIQDELVQVRTDKADKTTVDAMLASKDVFGASTIGTDAYKITSSTVVAYQNGMVLKVQADVANTGAATLELNTLGVKTIKKIADGIFTDLVTGDIITNQIFYCTYNQPENCFQFSLDPANVTVTGAFPSLSSSDYVAGENVITGDSLFVENMVGFSDATTPHPVGATAGNARMSFPIFGSGVSVNTLKIALRKAGSPSADFNFRIETDNAGSPSGTLLNVNSWGGLVAGAVTNSFVDKTLTSPGFYSFTGKAHFVWFAGTYGSETINGVNYYEVGFSSVNTTTRSGKEWNGSAWVGGTNMFYATSSAFFPDVLSKTDADFDYKLPDIPRIAKETKNAGQVVKYDFDGITNAINTSQTYGTALYVSNTPGQVSTTAGAITMVIGKVVGTNMVALGDNDIESGNWYTKEIPMVATSATAMAGWSLTTTSVNVNNAGGSTGLSGSTGFDFTATTSLPGSGSAENYSPSQNKDLRIKFRCKADTTSNRKGFGLCVTASNVHTDQTNISNGLVRFLFNGSSIYAHNANGAAATSTDISSGITLTNWNTYEIIFNPGTDIKFYINGILKATHKTNIPSSGTLLLAYGSDTNGVRIVTMPPIISFEL